MADFMRRGAILALLLGLYFLLVAQFAWAEAAAGVLTALAGTVLAERMRLLSRRRFAVRPGWIRHMARLPGQLLSQSISVMAAAFRPVPAGGIGRSITVPFSVETGLPPAEEAARRALVVAALCFTPDSLVVLREQQGSPAHLVVHQLVSRTLPGHGDPAWLV